MGAASAFETAVPRFRANGGGRIDIDDHCVLQIDGAVGVEGEEGQFSACGSPASGRTGHRLAQRMMID